jgi:DNA-binding transcriptional regulator YhcF (GntR family)
LEISIDRSLPIPLTEQIRGQIKYAIAYGELKSGEALPPVRELADELDVAPMTISRVYRDLAHESLVVSRPRSGTFVAEIARINGAGKPAYHNLHLLLHNTVHQARLMGYPLQEIKDTFHNLVSEFEEPSSPHTVILVGNFRDTTQKYARAVEEILQELDIRVIPLIISDLEANLSAYTEMIQKARLTITIPTRYNDVRVLLEPICGHVVAVAFSLSKETQGILAALPAETRLGIVTTYPEFLQTMLDGVHSFAMLREPLRCAILGQTEPISEMFSEIDVLLYASGSESVLEALPDRVRAIEYLHTPVPESLVRLRPYLE